MSVAVAARIESVEPTPVMADSRCARCVGRHQSICANLPPELLSLVAASSRVRRLRRGEVLSWEDEPTLDVGNVRDGALKLTASLRDGREQILGVAWPGAFVGELFSDRSDHRLTALSATTICVFRRGDLLALATEQSPVALAVLRCLSGELSAARRSILSLGRKTVTERVASLLIEMRRIGVPDASGAVQLSLNRQQMADLLGTTIETVSRKIHRFAATGTIELAGLRLFRVLDEVGLQRLAG